MSIACTGFERQTEKFLTIYKKSCAIVLNADLNIIPLIRLQQMSRVGIFFNQRFDTGLVYIIKLTVVTTKTGSGIIITTIAYIKKGSMYYSCGRHRFAKWNGPRVCRDVSGRLQPRSSSYHSDGRVYHHSLPYRYGN